MINEDAEDDMGCVPLTPYALDDLKRYDYAFTGLQIDGNHWIERAANVISNHKELYGIHIDVSYAGSFMCRDNNWLGDLCNGISQNRSIGSLSFEGDSYNMDVDIFQILMPFLENNANLHHIELHEFDLSQIVFPSFISALSKCGGFNLVHISLNDINCSDEAAAIIFNVLNTWENLGYLCFSENEYIGVEGCTALSNLLTNPATCLHSLAFSYNDLDDECLAIVSNALMINTTVEYLELSGNENVTSWRTCFPAIFSPHTCSVKRLVLIETNLTDDDVICLGTALIGNKTLKLLTLVDNASITLVGWQGLMQGLRNHSSVLEHLSVDECNIDADGGRMIVTALAENSSLKELTMFQNNLTTVIWDDFYWVLCDESSIQSTYSSNHTLERIWLRPWLHHDDDVPDYILRLLKMNRNEDKAQVARQKILENYFYEGGNVRDNAYQISVFAQMSKALMPFALEWIGNDDIGFSLMYKVVRGIPTLFGIGHGQQQRAGAKKRRKC